MKLTAASVGALTLDGKTDTIHFDDALPGFGFRLRLGSGGGVVIVVVFGVEVCVGRILRRLRHGVHGFHGGRLVAMTVEMGRHGWDCGCWVELWEE